MKLTICIPTHHGRGPYLRDLFDSILDQISEAEVGKLEICISDNASEDGTSELIQEYRATSPIPIKYFRFDQDMRGVRNFVNVVEMAEAEYCWLMGSDDVIPHDGIRTVLHALEQHPGIPAITVNKLNFDKEIRSTLGPDHDLVLPKDPARSRRLESFEEIASNLAIAYTYMSAHIFRREAWLEEVSTFGIDYLCSLRHFPHSFIFLRIARKYGLWLWIRQYCVIQRMGNFCILEDNGQRLAQYAKEITEDIRKVWLATIEDNAPLLRDLMARMFLLYWNPISLLAYKSDKRLTSSEGASIKKNCCVWFRSLPLFWLTSYPVLLTPAPLIRWSTTCISALDRIVPARRFIGRLLGSIAFLMSYARSGTRDFEGAENAAQTYLSAKKALHESQATRPT